MPEITPVPVIQQVIDDCTDRRRLSAGIDACTERGEGFSSPLEQQLAGIAMVAEARDLLTARLTDYWKNEKKLDLRFANLGNREVIIGAGLHAAIYAANRVRRGFSRPLVLERGTGEQVGGAFAVSMRPVFRLNSRTRPGPVGLPDQDASLNFLPGGLLQPSMATSEEYIDNAMMAWLIRLTLAQFTDIIPNANVTRLADNTRITLDNGLILTVGRVLDARGIGDPVPVNTSPFLLTFPQLMARMGNLWPLRGMRQVAVIGGGDSARCACESLLGIAPGNTSAIDLDYVTRVDWYTGSGTAPTCGEFRESQRGRYIRLAQYLEGNVSNPTTRLRAFPGKAYPSPTLNGVIVSDRTYDMAISCTGYVRPSLADSYGYFPVQQTSQGTILARQASPLSFYRIGPAADIPFSTTETSAQLDRIPANQVSIFRLASRTAALAALLPDVGNERLQA